MDSITQITLGASVGEAFLGKKAGFRAAAWGAFLGTLPDLDIIVNPFLDSVSELYFHRSITHSFFFVICVSPIFGWFLNNIHSQLEIGWKKWSGYVFWIFLTHILIDLPTTYGTQIFQPFTNLPFTTDAMFIIDPLFTLPLLGGLLASMIFRRKTDLGRTLNVCGLIFAAMYILWGHAIKSHVHWVYDQSFQNQYGYYEQMKTTPNGPTTFLWTGYVLKADTIYQSVYSIFDDSSDLTFRKIPRNSYLLDPYENDRAYEALLWFSRGYYTAEIDDEGTLTFYDLRFGRGDFWVSDESTFVWANHIIIDENGDAESFDQFVPSFEARSQNLKLFWNRIWGK